MESWDRHFIGLKQLQVDPDAKFAALTALAEWAATLQGDNPARRLLQSAHEKASFVLTQRRATLDGQRRTLEEERGSLEDERRRLEAGDDIAPPLPHTRDASVRDARQGAPFWQVVDFRDAVAGPQRAGLEAALEAAGMLDAWISPDGRLQAGDDGAPLYDTQVLERRNSSVACRLYGGYRAGRLYSGLADIVERVLSGIACADDDPIDTEAWIAADGRYRLGALSGAWGKPAAVYIGYAARAAARARRLAEVAEAPGQLSDELAAVQVMAAQLEQIAAGRRRMAQGPR